jgi:hypothetical protein
MKMTRGIQRFVFRCALLAVTLASTARADTLYVGNYGNNTVVEMSTPSGTITPFVSTNVPSGLAFGGGSLYVTDFGANTVSKANPSTGASTLFASISGPTALAFDSSGNLFVASYYNNEVYEVTPGGTVTPFASVAAAPFAEVLNPSAGRDVSPWLDEKPALTGVFDDGRGSDESHFCRIGRVAFVVLRGNPPASSWWSFSYYPDILTLMKVTCFVPR